MAASRRRRGEVLSGTPLPIGRFFFEGSPAEIVAKLSPDDLLENICQSVMSKEPIDPERSANVVLIPPRSLGP